MVLETGLNSSFFASKSDGNCVWSEREVPTLWDVRLFRAVFIHQIMHDGSIDKRLVLTCLLTLLSDMKFLLLYG